MHLLTQKGGGPKKLMQRHLIGQIFIPVDSSTKPMQYRYSAQQIGARCKKITACPVMPGVRRAENQQMNTDRVRRTARQAVKITVNNYSGLT